MFVMRIILLFCASSLNCHVGAQIPGFGRCPDYQPIDGFNKEKFLGKRYEAEGLFTITELASKCISATHEKRPDGNISVDNTIANRLKISGTMKLVGEAKEAEYNVGYNSLPIAYDTTLNVLDTDYKNFAVIYSCTEIGPAVGHTHVSIFIASKSIESVWGMTRNGIPPGPVLQRACGVLYKFKIFRSFFIETDQTNCEIVKPPQEAYYLFKILRSVMSGIAQIGKNEKNKRDETFLRFRNR